MSAHVHFISQGEDAERLPHVFLSRTLHSCGFCAQFLPTQLLGIVFSFRILDHLILTTMFFFRYYG